MLCNVCKESLQIVGCLISDPDHNESTRHLRPGCDGQTHHVSLDAFYRSIRDGCFICRYLWISLYEDGCINEYGERLIPQTFEGFCFMAPALKEILLLEKRLTYFLIEPSHSGCMKIGIYFDTSHDGAIRTLLLSPALPDQTVSDDRQLSEVNHIPAYTGEMMQLWHGWFRTCSETHIHCRQAEQQLQTFTPTRLIQLLPDDHAVIPQWQLVHSTIPGVPYLTLSHCWGLSQPTRLTKDNLSEFLQPSSVLSLPETYQHAITIAHSLNFRYLWIDSLCIIQDDEEDWKAQSQLMGLVYQNAACNIAATWAADSDDGCFSYRNPDMVRQCFVTLSQTTNGAATYQISDVSSYLRDVVGAPLNSRGWVIQERYFARRQLSFTKNQIYWECHELVASEQFPSRLPDQGYVVKPRLDYDDKQDIRLAWCELVMRFSGSRLTRKTDKLYAISGLITELQKFTGDTCIAGLWKKNLCRQLCWRFSDGYNNRRTTQGVVAPTWSWANLDGPVWCDSTYLCDKGRIIPWVEVLQVDKSPAGMLFLKGVALHGHATMNNNLDKPLNKFESGAGRHNITLVDPIRSPNLPPIGEFDADIYWDENIVPVPADPSRWPNFLEQRNSELLFLVVLEFRDDTIHFLQGLVLRKPSSCFYADIEYVRMGMFKVFQHVERIVTRLRGMLADVKESTDLSDVGAGNLVEIINVL
ncbi:heterokaryon incompatibility protein-domain-containing protein [Xylaria cf. heliscus]|nr:heterokaryon incompatibility protein-domain-containing protein [Xylaria cf. heliscus]